MIKMMIIIKMRAKIMEIMKMKVIKVTIMRVIVKSYNESDSENDSNGN
ncbi:MAG: hypothetical protein [Bacteriophage sp.]|nr:MAG: hypothetical protein [Bacteriophage sp.]